MAIQIFRRFISMFLALLLSLTSWSSALSAAGVLDPTFGTGGIVTTDFGGSPDVGNAVAIQADGKIIVAGYGGPLRTPIGFALARYNSDGSLDSTFGTDGKVTTDFGTAYRGGLADVVVQPDGKIVVAGQNYNGSNHDFALVRFNSDGSLDTTFDTDGKVITDFGGDNLININTASAEEIEMLPSIGPFIAQRIVDYRNEHGLFATIEDILNVPGIGPGTFDRIRDLITIGTSDDFGYALVLQPDGRIVVGGRSLISSDFDFALARYNSDGSLDKTFDNDGRVTTDFGNSIDWGNDIELLPDGRIIVVGTREDGMKFDFALARYNSDGSLDKTFDRDGKVITDFKKGRDTGSAVMLQLDGRIVVAGGSHTTTSDFALARYNSNGSLDKTFDKDGRVITDFGNNDIGTDLAIQPDGKIVAGGQTGQSEAMSNIAFALARFNGNGSLDTTFDTDGLVTTSIGGIQDQASAVALQTDGKIVLAGSSLTSSGTDFALARYDAEASGVGTISVPGKANPWLAGMPDGTISLFGDSAPANSPTQVSGVSIAPGGSLSFSATGLISHAPPADPLIETSGPDGGMTILSHDFGPENGISDIHAPVNALLGVFLGPKQPDRFPGPDALDFSEAASRDYLSLSPQLQQVFFIGDGLTATGQVQQIIIPAGATRLFLGPMDASQYLNNEGSFSVQILILPSTARIVN
jgi:competence ComEA-like helix-hairpin-helix protein